MHDVEVAIPAIGSAEPLWNLTNDGKAQGLPCIQGRGIVCQHDVELHGAEAHFPSKFKGSTPHDTTDSHATRVGTTA